MEEPKWISVKDRLPETLPHGEVDQVLIFTGLRPCGVSGTAVWCNGSFYNLEYWHNYESPEEAEPINLDILVSHWMPLPEPPKQ